jgi:F-type H+-transporting ATPase subunit gamma
MTRRHEIDTRLHSLEDIGKIMRSMKNLSYMETRKLSRFLDSQRLVVAGIEEAARDFLSHYPDLLHPVPHGGTLCLAIGAERGFCGSFNETVLGALDRATGPDGAEPPLLVAVGDRLSMLLAGHPRLVASIPGATAAEEVPAVLGQLVPVLTRLAGEQGIGSLSVVHWDPETDGVLSDPLLPPFRSLLDGARPAYPCPPRLNLAPETFLAILTQQYLLAALHAHLFGSLMAEHRQRVRHLEGALARVDGRVQELRQRRNLLRQEEITEEIELILLNLPVQERPEREDRAPIPILDSD